MRPYIGICDFTHPKQSEEMASLIPPHFSHDLMVGLMMSHKTLTGLPTKWADVFPKKEAIKDIFINHPRVLNTIHYADYEVGDKRDTALAQTLEAVVHYGGKHLHAIQLDMIWPDPTELLAFRRQHHLPIVLQVGADAMQLEGDDPLRVCERIKTYEDSIDCVLFDKSMGKGKGMDAALLTTYVRALSTACPSMRPAVGGGLGPQTMYLVPSLVGFFPDISIDAQGQLRPDGRLETPIDWVRASSYLKQAIALFAMAHQ